VGGGCSFGFTRDVKNDLTLSSTPDIYLVPYIIQWIPGSGAPPGGNSII